MIKTILSLQNLNKKFGEIPVTDNLSLEVQKGHIHALIGPNGAGKSTLIKQISGALKSDSGNVVFDGKDISQLKPNKRALLGLGRTFQISSLVLDFTVLQNAVLATQVQKGHSYKFFKPAMSDASITEPAMQALEQVNLSKQAHTQVAFLSHGERRQLEIAIVLAMHSKLLLLDEPLAGLGVEDSQKMIALLQTLHGEVSILLVEHDMEAVFSLADKVSVLVYGKLIATGNGEQIRNSTEVQKAYLG